MPPLCLVASPETPCSAWLPEAGVPQPAARSPVSPDRAPHCNRCCPSPSAPPCQAVASLTLEDDLREPPWQPPSSAPFPERARAHTPHSRGRAHSLEPHADEGAELHVHLCMCGVVSHVNRLHSLGGTVLTQVSPAAHPRGRSAHGPPLPGRAAPLGSGLCRLRPT